LIMNDADLAIEAIERLPVPQGRMAGDNIKLAKYQSRFIRGALAADVSVGVWSIGRGNGKTATAAALALTHLIGAWDGQPQREVVIAGRTAEQASIAFAFAQTFLDSLPDDMVTFTKVQARQHPHFS